MARKRVKIAGLTGSQASLKDASKELRDAAAKADEAVAEQLAANIRADTPVDTGDLLRSVKVGRGKRGGGVEVHVGGRDAPHQYIVEAQTPFIEPNVEAMRAEAPRIAAEIINKELRG